MAAMLAFLKILNMGFCCTIIGFMQKIQMIRPIDSEQRNPLRMHGRTHARTHGRGESDNPPKFSIENCRGAITCFEGYYN